MKFVIEKYQTPQKKDYMDIQKYEVARFEYGDYDNWADAIILDIKPIRNNTVLEIVFTTTYGRVDTAYGFLTNGHSYFNIIGKAKELDLNKDIQK